jgi:hypothetical protein
LGYVCSYGENERERETYSSSLEKVGRGELLKNALEQVFFTALREALEGRAAVGVLAEFGGGIEGSTI